MSQTASTVVETSQALFDDTPLPDGWRRVRLRDVIREAQGGFASGERDSSGVVQLRMNNVTTSGQFDWSSYIRVPASYETVQMYQLESGDVLFNNTNSTELVGKSALFEGHDEPVVFSNHFTRLRTDESLLEPGFLASWLQHQWQRHVFADICNRWIGQSAVQRDKLLALEISLPPLSEQNRIAAILKEQMAAVEQARAAAEAQLKAAKDLPAAFMRSVFDSTEAQQWTVKRLDEVCLDISDGTHFTPTYVPKGVPFLSVKDVKEIGISFSSCRYITEEQHRDLCRRCKPEKGDVLYTKVGTTGIAKAIDVDREFSIFVSVALLKLKPDVLPEYMEKVLNSPLGRAQAADLTQGMANRNLVIRDIKQIEVPIPPIEIQRHIVGVLGEQLIKSEQTREQLQTQLDTINKLPASLLRQAFTGKL
ncbi:MAG: restriction endonuclease subunit S [Pyrinomonadaceae bacterium]